MAVTILRHAVAVAPLERADVVLDQLFQPEMPRPAGRAAAACIGTNGAAIRPIAAIRAIMAVTGPAAEAAAVPVVYCAACRACGGAVT
jgi:hypothetical protein